MRWTRKYNRYSIALLGFVGAMPVEVKLVDLAPFKTSYLDVSSVTSFCNLVFMTLPW